MFFRVTSILLWCGLALGYSSLNPKYSLNPTRKDVAVDVLKQIQKNSLTQTEFLTAHSWCTEHESDDRYLVSFVCNKEVSNSKIPSVENIDYMVLYRTCHQVFTISGLVRLQQATTLSASDVFVMLRKDAESKGYLQLHELKLWCSGRYPMETFLDDMFLR